MMKKNKMLFNRILLLSLGSTLMGIGVVLATSTVLGADSVALLWEGMHIKFQMSLGVANYIFTAVFLVLVLIVDYKQIGIGTILAPIIQGLVMDVTILFLPDFNGWIVQFLIMLIGIILIAIGGGITAGANIGKNPYIGFTFAINRKQHCSLSLIRILFDALCLIIGLFLGAELCVGPIVSVVLMGPITEISCRKVEKMFNKKNSVCKVAHGFE